MPKTPEEQLATIQQASASKEANNSAQQAAESVVTQTREEILAKPFPFAIYPILMAHAAVLVVGAATLINDCVTDDTTGGETLSDGRPTANYVGTMDSHTNDFVTYSKIDNFQKNHRSVWIAMQKETSPNTAKSDVFAALNAIIDKDEAKLLALTKKYSKVDFLPAYLIAKSPGVKDMVAYATANGPEQAISKLMREKENKEDKTDVWPYRAALLKDIENKGKNRKKEAQEVWDSCGISQDPNLFTNFPDTGKISKRLLTKLEDPTTAGQPVAAKGLDGEPMLDAFGQICIMREAYAKELETANKCVFEKSKKELVPRYCYRSAYMQSVVRSFIKAPPLHKCDKDEEANTLDRFFRGMAKIKSKVTGKGNDMAAPPGLSIHQFAVAIDFDDTPKSLLESCLPPYWKELEGDPGHRDASQVPKPKNGNCTTVDLHGGEMRPFCFYQEKKEGKEATGNETLGEGEYARVPEGEIPDSELVRIALNEATPEIVAMSKKIQVAECKHTSVPKLREGDYHLFRYNTSDGERFGKLEVHKGNARNAAGRWRRGKPVLPHCGCSTFRRK